jgi:hypothetical protein
MSREALISQIREGKLGLQDEVCKTNSYWIYLDEADEVKRQLGIEMPRAGHDPEEATETDLQSMTQELTLPPTQEEMEASAANSSAENLDGDDEDGTKVLSTRGRPQVKQVRFDRRSTRAHLGQMQPLVLGRVERPSFWRFIVVALIVLAGVGVAWVIRMIQISP